MGNRCKVPRLDDLTPASYNPREITSEALTGLAASLREFGDISGIVWNQRTGNVVCGHQRLHSLREKHGDALRMQRGIVRTPGDERFRVRAVDWPIEKKQAANIAANSPVLAGTFTDDVAELVAALEADIPELSADLLLSELLAEPEMGPDDPEVFEDAVPDPPDDPVTQTGDVWCLGDHRVLSGDCTDISVLERLLQGAKPTCMWTHPPYGVSYKGKTGDALEIENDDEAGLEDLLRGAFSAIDQVLSPGVAIYVAHPAGRQSVPFGVAFLEAGWRLHQTLVWAKDSMVMGHSDYHYRHEPILFGYKPGGGRRGRGGNGWYGTNSETSVLEYPNPPVSREHPTMKPVRLVAAMMRNSSGVGEVVFDPFLGSGSTLIGAEQLGRVCYGTEIDPRYCDVIVQRWQSLTGQEASHLGTGSPYSDRGRPRSPKARRRVAARRSRRHVRLGGAGG